MLVNYLGTLVTVTTLVKLADIRVAGENGESLPTEQPLNDGGNTFQFEPQYTPEGGPFVPDYTPEGWPFDPTEIPSEGKSGSPMEGGFTSQPTIGNIIGDQSPTETPILEGEADLDNETNGLTKCCDQAACDFAIGPDSECVEQEGYEEKCGQEGDLYVESITTALSDWTGPRFAGICMCKPGYSLLDGKCTRRFENSCCTDGDCELRVGVFSVCGNREGGNPEICNGVTDAQITQEVRFTGEFRLRREVGLGEATSTTSAYDLHQGECICKPGYTLVLGDCRRSNTTEAGTTLGLGEGEFGIGTTETDTDNSGRDVTTTAGSLNPMRRKCYDFRCTGYNCTESFGSSNHYCSTEPGSTCYVTKQCEANGLTYIFGCEDPCSNMTIQGSRDCFTVTCTTRDEACNNETAIVDMYQCNSGSGFLMSFHLSSILLLLVVLVHKL